LCLCRRAFEKEALARFEPERGGFSGRKFQHCLGATLGSRPPRRDVVGYADHLKVPVEPDGVDREAHEERVDGGSGAKKKTFPPLELVTPQEPPHTRERCLR
jgi:hypothetical protein